ncbi:MAG: bifunctional diaminohydroxyphosphoribosylaminopyrimidine deaminase/5-amino-6-(5-phosphoribosylamino)uracil reductase RibD [Fimbriimonadaceae bacterium]|nr:bifunctional diaminohydroxyphosphoribosylaminopyrimidine deaminase/5-amino-6-(5-phosphoribosylamino)uracil reductase RibD [Fimbriimonadaceae bacterium]
MSPEQYLARACELAELARGRTSPNPLVGCVIVRDGEIVGEGYHRAAGQPHAERQALAMAGERARGATLYCTLEPCNHHGRTPPCTEAILEAGISAVYYGVDDCDVTVVGRGAARLRQAGLTVQGGLLREVVERQLAAYLFHRMMVRPWVQAKWAMTLDGKLAALRGWLGQRDRVNPKDWISGPAARALVHRRRDQVDAVLVGAGTVMVDDPSLTCRLDEFETPTRPLRHPLRVIADSRGRTPLDAQVYRDGLAPTILATAACHNVPDRPGCEVWRLPDHEGQLDLRALLRQLAERGVVEVLSEAGGTLNGSLFRLGLINEVLAVIAPKLVGGDGPSPWDGSGCGVISNAVKLTDVAWERLGDDLLLTARVDGAGLF